ncbi:RNA polymerase-binding protein DksA [Thermomonospora echinospora]|uniref:RNA polymerase-binding protein DksA n=1 Tax=Thermomonospora echinospora TaxID=1992 RepID=A0A1H5SM73_9ACTN|nr:RNA polymerase-binding protein DksA [Thermomonospora echinospora]
MPALPVEKPSARGTGMAGTRGEPASSGEVAERTSPAKRRRSAVRSAGAKDSARAGADHATAQAAELPVRGDEERWTETELAEVRTRLDGEIKALRAEILAAETQIAEGDTSDGAGDDQADTGAKTYAREHEMALAHNSRDLLAQSERAIARMDAGTYGICESCGKPIGKARLQAFPRATLCVPCKTREERR